MDLLFVGGVMNLTGVALLGLYVLLEKLQLRQAWGYGWPSRHTRAAAGHEPKRLKTIYTGPHTHGR